MYPSACFLFDFNLFASIETISAGVVALFTVLLYFVTRKQRDISEGQQRLMEKQMVLMERQTELSIDMERGVLTAMLCNMLDHRILLRFKNTGRSHLWFGDILLRHWEGVPPRGQLIWQDCTMQTFTKMLQPGEEYTFEMPMSHTMPGELKKLTINFGLVFKVGYKTLGSDRITRFAWWFGNARDHSMTSMEGRPYVGRQYEFDVLAGKEPVE